MKRGSLKGILRQARSPRRAARSRGFGVHSPFAFRFIREVMRQPYAFYSYREIEQECVREHADPRVAKALYRLALFFRGEGLELHGPANRAYTAAIARGLAQGASAIAEPCCHVGVARGREEVEELWRRASAGMCFIAPEMTVYVSSDHLPHQSFKILLP